MRRAALADNFARERGFQMQAIEGLTRDDQQQFANRMGAIQNALAAEQQGLGAAQGIIGQMPTIQQNRVFDENLRLQAGAMLDQQAQAELNDRIRRFTEKDMDQIERLGFLQAAAGGSAGPYGTVTTSQPFNPLGMLGGLFSLFL